MAIEFFYECKDCKKTYKEIRNSSDPQWFYFCDLCGGEYKETAFFERPEDVIIPTEIITPSEEVVAPVTEEQSID